MNNITEENWQSFEKLLKLAYEEDIASGDVTTEAIVEKGKKATAIIRAKEDLVVCGFPFAEKVFKYIPGTVSSVNYYVREGDAVKRGTILMELEAELKTILTMERTALNILQRLCGIASTTASFVKYLEGSKIKLLDTRKTAPGMRMLEKYAVKTGGGTNHRMGLFDMFMIKDNHIEAAGGIKSAMQLAREANNKKLAIEVECKTLDQIEEVLPLYPDIIMLDNMDDLTIKKAIKIIDKKAKIEVSGNITKGRIPGLARFDIDFISSGVLTHSFTSKDLSLDIKN